MDKQNRDFGKLLQCVLKEGKSVQSFSAVRRKSWRGRGYGAPTPKVGTPKSYAYVL